MRTCKNEQQKLRSAKHYQANAEKYKENASKFKAKNPEKYADYLRKTRYGIEPDVYRKMLETQNNQCKICTKPFVKAPCIDHCHKTGKIRGLLCRKCNTAIGLLEDSIANITRAAIYLV